MRVLHDIVIPRIAFMWSTVADYLDYEISFKKGIEEQGFHDPFKCCAKLLEDWLSTGRGVSPKSWSKLIETLKQIRGLEAVTENIVCDLQQVGIDL